MRQEPPIDLKTAHRYFSASCFNAAWELIERPDRSVQQDQQMILLAHASLWHWTQRPDCTDKEMSIGFWQTSRVYALVDQADNARRYGRLCLDASQNLEPFYLGYAHEALARAEASAGNSQQATAHLEQAREFAQQVAAETEKKMLSDDLSAIQQTIE